MTLAPSAMYNNRVILHRFEESLAYWCELKQKLQEHAKSGTQLGDNKQTQITDVPLYTHSLLMEHFTHQENEVKSISSSAQFHLYKQAQYAIVALIDDQLLKNPPWKDDSWLNYLLENKLFYSRIAGQRLIGEIEKLVDVDATQKQITAQTKQLAYIYLSVLWQGFKGKLFNKEERLKELQSSLIQLTEYTPVNLNADRLLEQPYNFNSEEEEEEAENRRLAPISRWHRVVLFGIALYAIVSTGIWYGFTWDLKNTLENITHSDSKAVKKENSPAEQNKNKEVK
ncbi:DotU family type IV/VI secretion system protein [Paraneptunicella aestuarii]|uniref:DotU family type IV/VI secretion system protein n=1 Tax=Paraneptunicella aestuarii TaxID=2831148 RepID=UPI001E4C294F|nr:DotU family type IV/VI secretion system protein [Paraneptunicella aestuarii]UAA37096.1 DotU family type IV/VI secretion system protein [Paraneptunicella aestuarii]